MTNATKGREKSPKKTGRPTSFKPEYIDLAKKFALLGATDKQMADNFDVSEVTFNAWKKQYPDFLKSLNEGKLEADALVAQSLYHRALGYSHKAVKMFNVGGTIEQEEFIEHYPPDTTACIFWLKNRQSAKWRDKVEAVDDDNDDKVTSVTVTVKDANKRNSE